MAVEVGKIYKDNSEQNVVLVFGVADRPLYKGSDMNKRDGVGVNLTTGKVDEVSDYSSEVATFRELDETQLTNFGHFYPILMAMLKNSLVAISGKARSGKDTLAGHLVRYCGFKQTALGDPIKRIHSVIYGNMTNKDREGLIMIGQGMRDKDPNVWIKAWLRMAIDDFDYSKESRLVISDVRQPNEFTFFKSMGALTVGIDANEEKRKAMLIKSDGENALDEKLLNDETESYVSTFDTDMTIYNEYDKSYEDEMETVEKRFSDEG